MPDFCSITLQDLVDKSVVSTRLDETGRLQVAANLGTLQFRCLLDVSSPLLEFSVSENCGAAINHSKLDLIRLLHSHGFRESDEAPQCWSPESPLFYRSQAILTGSKLYFVCLVLRSQIFDKGAAYILHAAPSKYYRTLLTLKNLRAFHAIVDAGGLTSEVCESHLEAVGVVVDEPSVEQLALEDAHEQLESDQIAASAPLSVAAFAAQRALLKPEVLPVIAIASATAPIVYFDNCSHASGVVRGYSKCVWNHTSCRLQLKGVVFLICFMIFVINFT